jgi:uncharacterized protein YwqG
LSPVSDLQRKLIDAGLGAVAEELVQRARPSYRVQYAPAPEGGIGVGASKFGGLPDIPAGFVSPGESIEFVAQIRVADLPAPLPEPALPSGLLSFFKNESGGRVFHFPEGTVLQRDEAPPAPAEPESSGFWKTLRSGFKSKPAARSIYRSGSLSFELALSPADGTSSMIELLKLSEADVETYIELCETQWPTDTAGAILKHQMFGHASPVQNEMELECQFLRRGEKLRWNLPPDDFIAATRDWVLLLQLDSDDGKTGPGWMWGDLGMVYFWIHRDDLAAHAFDRAIIIEQCH